MNIRISVYWQDDWKAITISKSEYQSILDGNPFEKGGEGYSYDGADYYDWWSFKGGVGCNLVVSYSGGGVGFDGSLSDCEIEEIDD